MKTFCCFSFFSVLFLAVAGTDKEDESDSSAIFAQVEAHVGETSGEQPNESSMYAESPTTKSVTVAQNATSKKSVSRPSRREQRKLLFDRMVRELGENDPKKMEQLTTAPDSFYRQMNNCFMSAYESFTTFCRLPFMGGGVKYFKLLLSVACEADWLDTDKIDSIVSRTCQPRLFGDH